MDDKAAEDDTVTDSESESDSDYRSVSSLSSRQDDESPSPPPPDQAAASSKQSSARLPRRPLTQRKFLKSPTQRAKRPRKAAEANDDDDFIEALAQHPTGSSLLCF